VKCDIEDFRENPRLFKTGETRRELYKKDLCKNYCCRRN